MVKHEMEWGDDEFTSDDPICTRCTRPYSEHVEHVGITHEDETLGVDNSWKDRYTAVNDGW